MWLVFDFKFFVLEGSILGKWEAGVVKVETFFGYMALRLEFFNEATFLGLLDFLFDKSKFVVVLGEVTGFANNN